MWRIDVIHPVSGKVETLAYMLSEDAAWNLARLCKGRGIIPCYCLVGVNYQSPDSLPSEAACEAGDGFPAPPGVAEPSEAATGAL